MAGVEEHELDIRQVEATNLTAQEVGREALELAVFAFELEEVDAAGVFAIDAAMTHDVEDLRLAPENFEELVLRCAFDLHIKPLLLVFYNLDDFVALAAEVDGLAE